MKYYRILIDEPTMIDLDRMALAVAAVVACQQMIFSQTCLAAWVVVVWADLTLVVEWVAVLLVQERANP
jgi:hypothetical protein